MFLHKRLTPRECLHIQIERNFLETLGKCEHETTARQLLVEMCRINDWNCCFDIADFNANAIKDMGSWIRFVNGTDDRFVVNEHFIRRMHYVTKPSVESLKSILKYFNIEVIE